MLKKILETDLVSAWNVAVKSLEDFFSFQNVYWFSFYFNRMEILLNDITVIVIIPIILLHEQNCYCSSAIFTGISDRGVTMPLPTFSLSLDLRKKAFALLEDFSILRLVWFKLHPPSVTQVQILCTAYQKSYLEQFSVSFDKVSIQQQLNTQQNLLICHLNKDNSSKQLYGSY